LVAGPAKLALLGPSGPQTLAWGYNGAVPGPLLRVRKGEPVAVRLINKLDQPTTISWHGVRNSNAMDGVGGLTQQPVPPGGSFDYAFTPPDAGIYWYHPHVFPLTADQIRRGLYGILIVDEPQAPEAERDLLIVIDDWMLGRDGGIVPTDRTPDAPDAHVSAIVTVNSLPVPGPPMVVRPGARLRLRIVNVCAERIAIVTMAGLGALVVAIDGQPSEVFPPAGDSLPIGPGARFEVFVDMPAAAGTTVNLLLRGAGEADRPLLVLKGEGVPLAARPRVSPLPANPLLPTRIPLEASLKRNLVLEAAAASPSPDGTRAAPRWRWTIDGVGSDGFSGRPLFRLKRGHAVTLAFINKSPLVQQMHVHGHVFRILHDLDDGWDPYWRESILIGPGKTKHIAFIADNPGRWALESLVLDRQVSGLAGYFEVT
jgi:FtsP/CotA-like multicopper oxidase with cupredoxin domain